MARPHLEGMPLLVLEDEATVTMARSRITAMSITDENMSDDDEW
jgi:hypothetical protein